MITIVNFSASKDANCIKIANHLKDLLNNKEIVIYNFEDFNLLPCGYCDYECIKRNEKCQINDKLNEIYESISNSEEAIYILPNYCDYPCANFFIFNERGNGYYSNEYGRRKKYLNIKKKFIVISNSCDDNFKKAFSYHVNGEPKILYIGAKKMGSSSLDKNLADNEGVKKLLKQFVKGKYHVEHSAMAVVIYKQSILCIEEEIYGKINLSLPKGHIEEGEDVVEAAIRECYEETNVLLSKDNVVEMLEPYEVKFTNHHYEIVKKKIYPVLFLINEQGEPKSKENKISKVEFMNVGKFLTCCSYSNVVNLVKYVILKLTDKFE